MGLHCADADRQFVGYHLVGGAGGQKPEDLDLSGCEDLSAGTWGAPAARGLSVSRAPGLVPPR